MKAKLQVPCPLFFQEVEVEGTPDEIAAFVRALGKEQPAVPPVSIPTVWICDECPLGGAHRYPEVWLSVSPAPCQKCGLAPVSVQPTWTVEQIQKFQLPTTTLSVDRTPHCPGIVAAPDLWHGEGP